MRRDRPGGDDPRGRCESFRPRPADLAPTVAPSQAGRERQVEVARDLGGDQGGRVETASAQPASRRRDRDHGAVGREVRAGFGGKGTEGGREPRAAGELEGRQGSPGGSVSRARPTRPGRMRREPRGRAGRCRSASSTRGRGDRLGRPALRRRRSGAVPRARQPEENVSVSHPPSVARRASPMARRPSQLSYPRLEWHLSSG